MQEDGRANGLDVHREHIAFGAHIRLNALLGKRCSNDLPGNIHLLRLQGGTWSVEGASIEVSYQAESHKKKNNNNNKAVKEQTARIIRLEPCHLSDLRDRKIEYLEVQCNHQRSSRGPKENAEHTKKEMKSRIRMPPNAPMTTNRHEATQSVVFPVPEGTLSLARSARRLQRKPNRLSEPNPKPFANQLQIATKEEKIWSGREKKISDVWECIFGCSSFRPR